jgi:hypothetical protein
MAKITIRKLHSKINRPRLRDEQLAEWLRLLKVWRTNTIIYIAFMPKN